MARPHPTPLRVLLVDDEAAIRSALRRFLTRRGWEVEEAGEGATALGLLRDAQEGRYSAVLCDLGLPGVSGPELYRRLREERPEMVRRLVFSSGDVHSPEAVELAESTECPLIEKPFDLAGLHELLKRAAGA